MPLTIEQFAAECQRRLIDAHFLGVELGIRDRRTINTWIEAGKLPAPVIHGGNHTTYFDRDAIPALKK